MTNKELNSILIENFPELSSAYHEEIDWQEGYNTGCHIVYGDVFEPFIEKMVTGKKCAELKHIFDFVEILLEYRELYVEEVILFSILEKLNDNQELINYCRPFMSNLTISFLNELQHTVPTERSMAVQRHLVKIER